MNDTLHERCAYSVDDIARLEATTGQRFAGYLADDKQLLVPIFLTPASFAQRAKIVLRLNGRAAYADDNANIDDNASVEGDTEGALLPPASPQGAEPTGRPLTKLPDAELARWRKKGWGYKRIAAELNRLGVAASPMTVKRRLAQYNAEKAA